MSCIVADTGPLIALAKVDLLMLPQRAFGRVVMPQTVLGECLAQALQPDATAIRHAVDKNLLAVEAVPAWPADVPKPRLDEGEAAALALALRLQAPVLMDELRGRKIAQRLGIHVVGVCGLLLFGKREGWLPEVAPLLVTLREKGYFISAGLQSAVLHAAGEG